jgi:hypothetical protein
MRNNCVTISHSVSGRVEVMLTFKIVNVETRENQTTNIDTDGQTEWSE